MVVRWINLKMMNAVLKTKKKIQESRRDAKLKFKSKSQSVYWVVQLK